MNLNLNLNISLNLTLNLNLSLNLNLNLNLNPNISSLHYGSTPVTVHCSGRWSLGWNGCHGKCHSLAAWRL